MSRCRHGGRHELGQNFLTHRPTLDTIASLVAATRGAILELGAGDGALTRVLAETCRPITAVEIDEHRARRLSRSLPAVSVVTGDALRHPLDGPVVVGNIPFHLTTPILRRLLAAPSWRDAVLVTQWEVARKRAGVGGRTMMTAQSAPWFDFALHGRVPRWGFSPQPSVDGGVLGISRRALPLVADADRRRYESFVRTMFTARGRGAAGILRQGCGLDASSARRALAASRTASDALPRDLSPTQWADLWRAVSAIQRMS
ncbi:23S ribosomal RNA methyltransferase Erm [Microbacterium sp. cf332]|uniref:23S ribosomal RNA methyltransferase Erm n=1 Tax=Microbacterium sp. cf332 TaxID=1761804 RepID=UPI000889BEB0|nr:23S ribosomal RNA methyltransferase Erm [Microbacterium sp. cf332]SDQ85297.1 23S rRNA (adenine-N6)-dimethyltransferase [Microbacterium sp. cf332]